MNLDLLDGWLFASEGRMLADLAANVPTEQAIVELGSFKGKSTAYLASTATVPVHAVDLWPDDAVYQVFCDQLTRAGFTVGTDVVPHRSDTSTFAGQWPGPPPALVFVDADHTYEGCLADWEAWSPLVASDGVMAFHDYTEHWPGVRKVIDRHVRPDPTWSYVAQVRGLYCVRKGAR